MGKTVLVTGGSSGIGLAVAALLTDHGYQVVSLSRSAEKIARARKEHPEITNRIDFISGDISKPGDAARILHYLDKNYGVLHGLVNNAGVLTKGSLETISLEDWQYTLNVNLNGPFILTKALLPLLRKANGASVVNISSVAGLKPGTSLPYSVSKAGLDMFTRFLAGDLGTYGIRVNSVNPGLVRTNIHLDNQIVASDQEYETMLEKSRPRYPLGRIGNAHDVAAMVCFLISEEAGWVTGSIITVDGGVMVENDLIPPKNV
ncbi:MAG: SDR family oxidoreductase [Bacteroidales bacterium]|nr:SDR family oxidoreductase [Bacteroidales bacterium]